MPSDMTFRTAFGSWGKALKAAGFKPIKLIPIGARKGKKNKKGVAKIMSHGYIHIFKPEHPLAMRNGYVREHRMIAWDAGLLTNSAMEVHHINGIKTDNRLANLEVITKQAHTSHHFKGVKIKRKGSKICRFCEKITASKYQLCSYHYRRQWSLVKSGKIKNIYEHKHLLEATE